MMVRGRLLRVDSEWADDAGGISRVRYQRGERRKVDATRSRHRQRGCQAHGRQAAISFEGGARLAARAPGSEARFDASCPARAWRLRLLRQAVALPETPGDQL